MDIVNLNKSSQENLTFMLEKLAKLLDVANHALLDPKHYDLNKYDEIKYMYDMITRKGSLTMSETEAFIDELRSVRSD